MPESTGSWIVSQDTEAIAEAKSALEIDSRLLPAATCRDLRELASRLDHERAALALIDIDPDPDNMLRQLPSLIDQYMPMRFVVMASNLRSEWVIEAMNAGARHFLIKGSIAHDLASISKRLIPSACSLTPTQRGRVITILSAGGGCGATTLAVNLASELKDREGQSVMLIDLDPRFGTVANYLGLRGEYGIADVLQRQSAVDPALLQSTSVETAEGVDVLLSPASINFTAPMPLDFANLGDVLKACAAGYAYTVVDAPCVSMDAAAALAGSSAVTLVVMQMTVKDIQAANAIAGALSDRGIRPDSIVPIANRYRNRRSEITIEEARRALGDRPITALANDYRAAVESVNLGQPLKKSSPRSVLRKDIQKLADDVVADRLKQSVGNAA